MTPIPRGPQQQSAQQSDSNHVSQDRRSLSGATRQNAKGASTAAYQDQEGQTQDGQSEMYQDGYFPPTDDSPPTDAEVQSGNFTERSDKTRYGEGSDVSVEKTLDNATNKPNELNVVSGKDDFDGTQDRTGGFSGTHGQVEIQKDFEQDRNTMAQSTQANLPHQDVQNEQKQNHQFVGAPQDQVIGARGPLYGAAAEAKRGHLMGAAAEAKKGHLMGAAAENVKGNLQGAAAIAHEQKMQRESGQGQLQLQIQQRVFSGNNFDPKRSVIGGAAQTNLSDPDPTQRQMAQKESKRVNELDEAAIPAKQMKYDEFNLRSSPQSAH